MWQVSKTLGVLLCASLVACGGGGGGSSSGNYAGTWDIGASRVLNDCGARVDPTFVTTIVVNQDNNRVVVNSGNLTLEGETNDRDGFTVSTAYNSTNGCQVGAGYSLSDASDGEANVGIALVVRCGSRECAVGYSGTATRRDSKMLDRSAPSDNSSASVEKALTESVLEGNGEEGQGAVPSTASELADLVAPAN